MVTLKAAVTWTYQRFPSMSHFAFPKHVLHITGFQPNIVVHQSELFEKESTQTKEGFAHDHPMFGWRVCLHS